MLMRLLLSLELVCDSPAYKLYVLRLTNLDYLFIGPNDLAQSVLGYTPARGDEPEFVDAIQKIVAAARKNGKWVGRLVNDGPLAVEAGKQFDSVAITGDTKAISNWYTAQIACVKGN
jgi:4-hydroxy-2-oxoheptanedioate aldolase